MQEWKQEWKQHGKTLVNAVELFFEKQSFRASAALAFYTLFSMAPLLILVITLAGVFLGDDAVRGTLAAQLDDIIGTDAAEFVQEAVKRSRIEQSGLMPTLLGVAALAFGATTVFAQLRSSLNEFWNVRAQPSRHDVLNFLLTRLVSFGMVLTIGFLMLTSVLISIALASVREFAEQLITVPPLLLTVADNVFTWLVVSTLFGLIFRVLPDVRLSWRNVTRGALVTGVLFMVGRYLISIYLTRTGPASAYGAAGSLVIVLMWVYYSSLILHFGTAITRALLEAEGGAIRPMRGAVRIHTQVVDDD